jgi:hypothetical protein
VSPFEFAVPPPSIDRVESRIALDIAKKAAIVTPIVVIALGVWRGPEAALAGLLAFALVIGNFLLSAAIIGWAARTMPHALTGVALLSFLVRLALITAIGAAVKAADVVDWPVFGITLIVLYVGLLFWELPSISLTLASPGLKPKPGQFEE